MDLFVPAQFKQCCRIKIFVISLDRLWEDLNKDAKKRLGKSLVPTFDGNIFSQAANKSANKTHTSNYLQTIDEN